jgi:diacylglycerol O-acyltransferase / wax synthase
MTDRLRARDLRLLESESPTTPRHNATVEIFDPGYSGFGYERLVELIDSRIAFVPRYRQKLQAVPARLANPAWVDDPEFELGYHVRRSALPRPGTMEQLRELVARVVSRPLDRARPLWEVYFVEGLGRGRVALLVKSHQILVDGVETVDLGQVLLDDSAVPKVLEHDEWQPRRSPAPVAAAADAVVDSLRDPRMVVDTARGNLGTAARVAGAAVDRVEATIGVLTGRRFTATPPLGGAHSQQRRFAAIRTELGLYREARRHQEATVNDVIVATVAGALRSWLMARGTESPRPLTALVPMSVIDQELEPTSLGSQVAGRLIELPIGEASAAMRLHQVSYALAAYREAGRPVAAQRLAGIAGFAPTTFHALGSRVATAEFGRGFGVALTNVPGPQFPLYAAGARMLESYPIHPLLPGHAISIGVTSYDGAVFYGITADRDLVPDIDVLAQCLPEALSELVELPPAGSRAAAAEDLPRAAPGKADSNRP